MKLEEIKKIVDLLEASKLHKLSLKQGDFELHLEKKQDHIQSFEPVKINVKEPAKKREEEAFFITSPMVGTFYKAASPEKASFVKQGDIVDEDTVVCIIEAMKVMNEVKAGMSGVVKEVLCRDSSPVEFGTKLFEIEKK